MQHVFIINQLSPVFSEALSHSMIDHCGRVINVRGTQAQQVNIQTLKCQVLPFVMLADQIEHTQNAAVVIPESALVSVVPFSAQQVQALLDSGNAQTLLDQFNR